ncbi:PREDICTED: melanoma-associated antigen 8-like [Chinchilla lanigera]|uniref:melanoma-associated antigen 8-like n=1 Tax=Chinchilla lanigera TaxID=34839 RepID=UPI00069645E7|nr:PREDICTED: melanoma-associated antigen 8-like [Chinchilla lanigera]
MPRGQRRKRNKLGRGRQIQRNTQVLKGPEVPKNVGEEAAVTASFSFFSSHTIIGPTPRDGLQLETPSCPQNPWGIVSSPTAMVSSQRSQSRKGSRQDVEGQRPSEDTNLTQLLHRVFLNDKLEKLVPFLLRKYQKKEQVTMEEMLHTVDHDYHEQFPLIFSDFCECMCLGFGIDVREVYPPGHAYMLVPLLGLTYNGLLSDDYRSFPQISILIVILTVIFMKGNSASEEDITKVLRMREMLAQRNNVAIGDPWKFITVDLVREGYLEYQEIRNSFPTRYEFLWGPRAHAETSKMKLREHLARLHRRDVRSYPVLYDEAVREEQVMVRAPEWVKWMPGARNLPNHSNRLAPTPCEASPILRSMLEATRPFSKP